MLAQEDLSRYKVIYINGPFITRAAAGKVARWVEAGGTLWTSGGGCAADEANRPLKALQPVLGLAGRSAPEMYYRVTLYGATSLERYDDQRAVLAPVPPGAAVAGGQLPALPAPVIGREVLKPAAGTEVLAKFADGGAAVTCRASGKGRAYVVGFFPGLEYSAPLRKESYDMSKDFDASRRAYVAFAALGAGVRPVVDASAPAVEGLLVKNRETGKSAVVLVNWAYRVTGEKAAGKTTKAMTSIATEKDLKVTVRGAAAAKAVSVWLDRALPVQKTADGFTVTVPQLEEGDVLLLE
jgi:hypothetical protein